MTRPALGPVVLCGCFAAAAAAGCTREKAAPPPPPPAKVTVTRPAVVPVQSYFEYNGTLETTQMVEIRARVKGLLTAVYFTEGTEVRGPDPKAADEDARRGARLYAIDDREYRTAVRKADAEVAKAVAEIGNWVGQIRLAESEVKRLAKVKGTGASFEAEQEKAELTLAVAQAQLASAKAAKEGAEAALHTAHIQLGYTDIRAPIAGKISQTIIKEGNLVGQTDATLLTTIVRMDELFVFFDAPERDLVTRLRERAATPLPDPSSRKFPLEIGVTGEEGYPHKGWIDFRENRVDPGTGTIRARGRVPNPPVPPTNERLLYPGLYARVRVPTGDPVPRPVIPEDALMTGQEGRYVFVVGADNTVAKRTVTVGTQVYRQPPAEKQSGPPPWTLKGPAADAKAVPVRSVVAIDKGLGPDDVVIVDGLQKARPGGPVDPEAWTFAGPAGR